MLGDITEKKASELTFKEKLNKQEYYVSLLQESLDVIW